MIIHTPSGRQLIRSGEDLFTGLGVHVARLTGNIAHAPSGRYVGTLEKKVLAYRSSDRLSSGPLFVRESHPGFPHGGEVPRTTEREDEPWIDS